jgi:bifunctional UDP-N-acetylglucosamine pyrophosphorylase/glucosamine-1-phosphate N-acetyltransferase
MLAQPVAGIVLAAGKGTRMKSNLPKVLHPICGVSMVEHVCQALTNAGVDTITVVVGHGADRVKEALGSEREYTRWEGRDGAFHPVPEKMELRYALQDPPQGTGDAVRAGLQALGEWNGPVVVCCGDTPLLTAEAIRELIVQQRASGAGCVVATFDLEDPTGYGRIVREGDQIVRIVEQGDATEKQQEIRELNSGVYCFDGKVLAQLLPLIQVNAQKGEYYLTDTVHLASQVGSRAVAQKYSDPSLFNGVNDRWQLAEADKAMRARINHRHAMNGISFLDPDSTFIEPEVQIEPDTILHPSTFLAGKTRIGSACEIGPCTRIKNSEIGNSCHVYFSQVTDSHLGSGVRVGPYAQLRMNAAIGDKVKIGNFVEIKNAELADGVSASHLSYLGDATVGPKTNIGAGTITCNYDGYTKNRTEIGANAFIGSNSTLVAPLKIGEGAMTAAGSVVSKNVPPNAAAFGRARQETKEEWAAQWRRRKQSNQ